MQFGINKHLYGVMAFDEICCMFFFNKQLCLEQATNTIHIGRESGNRTQVTLVGGEGSHHCAIAATGPRAMGNGHGYIFAPREWK